MYILGINAYHGDSSACLLKDGEVVCATEEERFKRIKHWAGFPIDSIQFCLKDAGINLSDVEYIAISRDPYANLSAKVFNAIKNRLSIKNIFDRVNNLKKASNIADEFAKHFPNELKNSKVKFINVEHHNAHLASAFFVSPFEDSAIISIDGFGDFASVKLAYGKSNSFKILDKVNYPHSLGVFYTTFTQFLGFPHYGDEYKIMGLAPYGNPIYTDDVYKTIYKTSDGLFKLNTKFYNHPTKGVNMSWESGSPEISNLFTDEFYKVFGPARNSNDELTQYHKDLAASVQKVCEELIFHLCENLFTKCNTKNLCLAGGVGQNSVANGKIIQNTSFENLYIPPAAHDAGTSIGAALYVHHQLNNKPRDHVSTTGYYGYRANTTEIQKLLESKKINYRYFEDKEELIDYTSNKIIDAKVVGWYQGRAEFGPRALGHRSILADPRRNDAKELLNSKIKRRESFRPFAPSILKEKVSDYFEIVDDVPFMEKVFKIKPDMQHLIPAVTHVDGTGRLQTVDKNYEPCYHRLIESFYEKTGVPILLNTSFNENEPIVNKPEEALDCYLRTKMDVLVMGNFVISRDDES